MFEKCRHSLIISLAAPSSEAGLSQSPNHRVEMEKDAVASLPLTMILHPVALSHTAQAAPGTHRSLKKRGIKGIVATIGGLTYYFGHEIAELEAVFGHHGTQDFSDWLGGLGFQPHRAVNGNQVQSRNEKHVQHGHKKKKLLDLFRSKQTSREGSYLNRVRFSSRKSRELRVMQSWSSTKGCYGVRK